MVTYRLPRAYRVLLYVIVGTYALLYVFFMIMVVVVEYDPTGIMYVQVVLLGFIASSCLFVRRSGTRISFHEDYFFYYGGIFRHQIPWSRVQEVIIEYLPPCRLVLHYINARNQRARIEVLLYFFADVKGIVGQLSEATKKRGIPLHESS